MRTGNWIAIRKSRRFLTDLKATGAKIAILSNGSPAMLDAAAKAAGLTELFDEIFSVDELRTFKTNPQTYEMVTTHFRIYPEEVSFQSSNRWDVAGATAFGFRTVWMNRTGMPDEYTDLAPKAVLADFDWPGSFGLTGSSWLTDNFLKWIVSIMLI
jgi:2-haloacid dehalogenase